VRRCPLRPKSELGPAIIVPTTLCGRVLRLVVDALEEETEGVGVAMQGPVDLVRPRKEIPIRLLILMRPCASQNLECLRELRSAVHIVCYTRRKQAGRLFSAWYMVKSSPDTHAIVFPTSSCRPLQKSVTVDLEKCHAPSTDRSVEESDVLCCNGDIP